jgi:hypothetical protein
VRLIVDKNLSAERLQYLVESGNLAALLASEQPVTRPIDFGETVSERVANRWPALAKQFSQADLILVADQWVKRQKPEEIRAQVAALRQLLDIVEKRVKP